MKNVLEFIERLSDSSIVIYCLLLCVLVGISDYVTGDFSLSLFYIVPIAMSSWFVGKKAGNFIALLCGLELYAINLLVAPENTSK
jgi:NADH:ubiquinone oxidoreductase subunit 2 (subunit N)